MNKRGNLNSSGYEVPDKTPLVIRTKLKRPKSIHDQVREALRQEQQLAEYASSQGLESPEEADDFDVVGPYEASVPFSPYEDNFDHVSNFEETKKHFRKKKQPKKEAKKLEPEVKAPENKPEDKNEDKK